jgi:predicted O-methyltransferase YrrM
MSKNITKVTDDLYDYILAVSLREPEILKRLREETLKDNMSLMQISPDQGQFMALLVKLIGARKSLDIGTYTGYSALSVALAMPDDSVTVACDYRTEWTDIAQRYWREAGVAQKIDLRLGPALATLDNLISNGGAGTFDFIFIDADKENYDNYYEKGLILLRHGGLIGIDNVLWFGDVIDLNNHDFSTRAIRHMNDKLKNDDRVDISLIPIGDGLTLARKR